jgi:hypothetical protein
VKVKELEDKLGNDATKTNKMESSRASPEVRRLTECIEEMRETVQSVSLIRSIPNTVQHQQIWNGVGEIVKTAFVPEIDDDDKGGYGGRGYVFKNPVASRRRVFDEAR